MQIVLGFELVLNCFDILTNRNLKFVNKLLVIIITFNPQNQHPIQQKLQYPNYHLQNKSSFGIKAFYYFNKIDQSLNTYKIIDKYLSMG